MVVYGVEGISIPVEISNLLKGTITKPIIFGYARL